MRRYPSKLLLFGEHVLLLGSTALAVPIHDYFGEWVEQGGQMPEALLLKMLEFAESRHLNDLPFMDAESFVRDLKQGLIFKANIPIGYGLGSSGAFCAAVYDRYAVEKTTDLSSLKSIFSRMESFFHGSSCGIDPLTSYLQKPLLIREKTQVSFAVQKNWITPPFCFLLDTRLPRQTEPLVNWFLAQAATPVFLEKLQMIYLPAHEALVQGWLQADSVEFRAQLQLVSEFQLGHFDPMIPANLRQVWQQSLQDGEFTLKICGAGGGGFMLGFCEHPDQLDALKRQFDLRFFNISPHDPV
jgi:mevalonate kinase